jgi:glutamine synthetase
VSRTDSTHRDTDTRLTLATVNHHGQFIGRVVNASERQAGAPLRTTLRDYLLANDLNHNEIRPHGAEHDAHLWFSGYGSVVLEEDRAAAPRSAFPLSPRLHFADAFDLEGKEIGVASRAVVKHLVHALDGLGLGARVATELEFYLVPADITGYSESQLHDYFQSIETGGDGLVEFPSSDHALIEELIEACAEADIETEGYSHETGFRQYELNFAPTDPLTSCDSHVLFKHLARGIARKHGCLAVFMAKPANGATGSSCHVNLSLTKGSLPVDPESAAHGLLRELPALALLLLPYANSYRRLRPGASLARLSLSKDRSSAVRVTDGRVEVRVAGADANPYLAVSAVLAAALCGVKAAASEHSADDIGKMPLSIEAAIEAAQKGGESWEILPTGLREQVIQLAQFECEVDRRQVTAFDRVRLLSRI